MYFPIVCTFAALQLYLAPLIRSKGGGGDSTGSDGSREGCGGVSVHVFGHPSVCTGMNAKDAVCASTTLPCTDTMLSVSG